MFHDQDYSANSYVRHFFQMAEFRGDNIVLCAKTTDPLNKAINYNDESGDGNTSYYWWISYKIIFYRNKAFLSSFFICSKAFLNFVGNLF